MEIQVGDKVRMNRKGLETGSDSPDWLSIFPGDVDKMKCSESQTVTSATDECLGFLDSAWVWPAGMFEVVSEKGGIFLSQEEKGILRGLLQSQIDTYTRLLAKLKEFSVFQD